jgi:Rrf2 family protein
VVSLREVGELEGISAKYLEHIMRALRTAGLVKAVRGLHGGYVLARPPESITLKDVFESLVGEISPVDCVDCPETCAFHDTCPTRDTWIEMKEAIEGILERTTIQQLVERKQHRALVPATADSL